MVVGNDQTNATHWRTSSPERDLSLLDTSCPYRLTVSFDGSVDNSLGREGGLLKAGRETAIVVPSPGALSMESVPPSCSTRSRNAFRPKPPVCCAMGETHRCDGSKPRPSSWTSSATVSSMYERVRESWLAWECLRALA